MFRLKKIVLVTKRSFWDLQEQFIRVDQIHNDETAWINILILLNFSFTSCHDVNLELVVLKWLTITNEFLRGHTLFRTFESTVPVFIIRGTWDFQLNLVLINYKISFRTFLCRLIYLGLLCINLTLKKFVTEEILRRAPYKEGRSLAKPWKSIQETEWG